MQVWILDETSDGDSNIYVHHEVPLSAFPLCTAWLDCPLKGGEKGNFIAVGSMEPAIEIWDLDIIDEVQPAVVLGGIEEKKKKKKGKKVLHSHLLSLESNLKYLGNGQLNGGSCTLLLHFVSMIDDYSIMDNCYGVVLICAVPLCYHSTLSSIIISKPRHNVSIKYKEGSHTDSVLGLAWNKHFRNILASASADKQVKIWDVDAGKCDITMEHHTDKARI
ncbi:hypothetical protein POTOM_027932 [Populus tomentosa]|uniref:Transducin/WD40 repeat-like superfamily protein n=1 Tax=Populus tomentosa TaxID=118781 RepID=A0A8X8CUC3_POPTO|nr:hypothetical protein POTOM_027932 [Populus tomentosa]